MDVEYKNLVAFFSNVEWEAPTNDVGWRQWLYQTCNEFGYYQTSNSKKQIFGSYLPLSYNFQMCADIFDAE
jgi:Serine carboxypeptidase S28